MKMVGNVKMCPCQSNLLLTQPVSETDFKVNEFSGINIFQLE